MIFDDDATNRIVGTALRALAGTADGRDSKAADAVAEALRLLAEEAVERGLSVLDYAQRLSPSDHGITFAIGLVRLLLGERRATEPLELLARRSGRRDVLTYLIMARLRFGDPTLAAAELHRTLALNAPDRRRVFLDLADDVAKATGSLGWCGLNNSGHITIRGAAAAFPARELSVKVDGVRVPLDRPGKQPGIRRATLPVGWARGRRIEVTARGLKLIGSPIDIGQVTRVEGFVSCPDGGGIAGWCWFPGEPETPPDVVLSSADRTLVAKAEFVLPQRRGFAEFSVPRGFKVSAEALAEFRGEVQVRGPHGRMLYGSPVQPHAALDSGLAAARAIAALYPAVGAAQPAGPLGREPSIAAGITAIRAPSGPPAELPGIDVIIPVYRGLKVTMDCLDSVLAARALNERIVVVVDASPDADLVAKLTEVAATGVIELRLETVNRGFPATANIGLRIAAGRDAVLLNSDTLVPPGWLALLRDAVYSSHDIGTATPLSNDATIFSYPLVDAPNPPLSLAEVFEAAELAQQANRDVVVDAPTGHGFCMYIRADCLAEAGVLREDVFAQGYGEENDFSMRARVFGWRHVAVPGAFVGHLGSQSFASTKNHLIERNLTTLNRLHVGYDRLVADWLKADPLAPARRNMDRLKLLRDGEWNGSVLLVSHGRGGGILRHVRERAALHEQEGRRALLLRPGRTEDGQMFCTLEHEAAGASPNLRFNVPEEIDGLRDLLTECGVGLVELHHFLGHDKSVLQLAVSLGCPYDVVVHDYAWLCPRVTLTNGSNRYCGEPAVSVCTSCVADHGNNIDEDIAPVELRARSAGLLGGARQVIVPSRDTARRIERHFGVAVTVGNWEPELQAPPPRPVLAQRARRRVCVVGAIGLEKGYDTLLAAARIAAERDLPLEFVLVGYSCDDWRLLQTGRVKITGRYSETEAVRLIRAQDADFAFLPALWPETWSYVLSQIWQAGLAVLAHDVGAPAERIRADGGGIVLPLHMSAERLVELFIDPKLFDAPVATTAMAAE
jgi:GT2 family glycosyltransferase/glycosyltransferase involved in cell wall biosynthesis